MPELEPAIMYRSQGEWISDPPPPERQVLTQRISNVLLAENLIILSGLGTSLCALSTGGDVLAPRMGDLWKDVKDNVPGMADVLTKVNYKAEAGKENIETFLSHCQQFVALFSDDEVEEFITQSEKRIFKLCNFMDQCPELPSHEAFLRRVARRSTRQPRMKLFTTNYDLCFETAATRTGFVMIDGFSHTMPQHFDGNLFSHDFVRRDQDREAPNYIPNVFHLYKLHGSVDWDLRGDSVIRAADPAKPMMIFPKSEKFELSYKQPYFEMMSRFQTALRQPNTGLLIIGYGFNDNHINEPINTALRSNVGLKAMVVTPAFVGADNAVLKTVCDLIDSGDSRLTAVAGKFEDFVPMIPDLVAQTEEEFHSERFKPKSK